MIVGTAGHVDHGKSALVRALTGVDPDRLKVRAIHAQNRPAEEGCPGERCALNLVGQAVSKDAIDRGDVVGAPELHAPTDRIDVELTVLASEPKPFGPWTPVRLHVGAADVSARLVPLEGDAVQPGDTTRAQLVLDRRIAAVALDRFVLRDTSGARTIAGGRILDLRAPARRRRSPGRRAQLAALSHQDHADALAALLSAPPHAVDLDGFLRDRNIGPAAAAALQERLGTVRLAGVRISAALAPEVWLTFSAAVTAALAAHHADHPNFEKSRGMPFQELFTRHVQETPLATSEPQLDFDDWFRASFAETGGFTALVVLVEISSKDTKPVASTFFHAIGDETVWKDIRKLFATAPGGWDGAVFFTATARAGGPVEEPLARIELRRYEAMIDDDRLAINEGAFFDRRGRRMRIDEDEVAE